MAKCVVHLTHNLSVVSLSPIKGPHCFLEQETYSHCLVLVGSRNGFKLDLHKHKIACFTFEF